MLPRSTISEVDVLKNSKNQNLYHSRTKRGHTCILHIIYSIGRIGHKQLYYIYIL